jgi:predicted transcriptional regulator
MSPSPPTLPDVVTDTLTSVEISTGRNEAELAADALRGYPAEEWQIREVQRAVQEADDGDFVSADEVRTIAEKWGRNVVAAG